MKPRDQHKLDHVRRMIAHLEREAEKKAYRGERELRRVIVDPCELPEDGESLEMTRARKGGK